MKIFFLGCLTVLALSSFANAGDEPIVKLALPVSLKIEDASVIFQAGTTRWNPMGDGFRAVVWKVNSKKLADIAQRHLQEDIAWQHQAFCSSPGNRETWKWMLGGARTAGVLDEMKKGFDFDGLAENGEMYYNIERKYNSRGDLSGAELWMIDSKSGIVAVVIYNT